jgi:hypothetical protein
MCSARKRLRFGFDGSLAVALTHLAELGADASHRAVWLICKIFLWLQIDSMRFAGINPNWRRGVGWLVLARQIAVGIA